MRGERGGEDNCRRLMSARQPSRRFQAADSRHRYVEEQDIDGSLAQDLQCGLAAIGLASVMQTDLSA